MSARPSKLTESKIARWHAEGRGKGEGKDYKPWLTHQDVPSSGWKQRPTSTLHRQIVPLFSKQEMAAFLLFDFSRFTTDIRAQFPLDRETTRVIAADLGIDHPRDPHTKIDIVMTTDLVVTEMRDGQKILRPISCKLNSGLSTFNDLEHAQIEKEYWLRQNNHQFQFFTETTMSASLQQNLFVLSAMRFENEQPEPYTNYFTNLCDRLVSEIRDSVSESPLIEFCAMYEQRQGLANNSAINAARFLMWHQTLKTDLQLPYLDTHPVNLIAEKTNKSLGEHHHGIC